MLVRTGLLCSVWTKDVSVYLHGALLTLRVMGPSYAEWKYVGEHMSLYACTDVCMYVCVVRCMDV